MPPDLLDARSMRRVMAPEEDFNHFAIARIAKQLSDAGVSVQLVVNGRLYDAATMNQAGNHPADRAKYYWERN